MNLDVAVGAHADSSSAQLSSTTTAPTAMHGP